MVRQLASSSSTHLESQPRPLRLPWNLAAVSLHLKTTVVSSSSSSGSAPSLAAPTDALERPDNLTHLDLQAAAAPSSRPSLLDSDHSQNRGSILESLEDTFRNSPSGELWKRWKEYHGSENWAGLLEPLDPDLRAEIVKYGELAQLSYDAFDCVSRECMHEERELLQKAGLAWTGYTVTKYIYASADVHVLPAWLEKLTAIHGQHQSSWMGFIAVATDEKQIARLGRRDIVVVWRGTVTHLEWLEDIDRAMIRPITHAPLITAPFDVGVERGFYTLYTSSNSDAPHGQLSASQQVRDEVSRLVETFKDLLDCQLSITISGHSLGGALALLSAHDIASNCPNLHNTPIAVISFAAPRVGNEDFKAQVEELGIKILRIVNVNDMVPKVPGIWVHDTPSPPGRLSSAQGPHAAHLEWSNYAHAGVKLSLDNRFSPFLKAHANLIECHNLEVYLHLVDGYRSLNVPFVGIHDGNRHSSAEKQESLDPYDDQLREVHACLKFMKRDVALVNKTTDLLIDDLHVQPKWQETVLSKPFLRLSPLRFTEEEQHCKLSLLTLLCATTPSSPLNIHTNLSTAA